MLKKLKFPEGLNLLTRWQSGDKEAKAQLKHIFDATIAGEMDEDFARPAPRDRVHVSGSVHMLALALMYDLYGVTSAEFYKTDGLRYARTNLITSRLLGIDKFYSTWALYAFTCEAVGQKMMYPDKFPPGSDPDEVLITRENWKNVTTPDFDTGIPAIINEFVRETEKLTGIAPLLQISAPYSLAADIYGQEPLLADVVHDPDFVNELLDHLADTVLTPWIEHFLKQFPNGWIELSDASGSPFFIGPDNCKNMAIRAMQCMIEGKTWADRLFDCNYRGDFVAQAKKRARGSRRRAAANNTVAGVDLLELTDLKHSVCPCFIMRLEADRVPVQFYEEQAIQRGIPLTTGIGSGQVDANSVGDLEDAKREIRQTAREFVGAIKNVCDVIGAPEEKLMRQPWPSHIYFEDISAESQFEMIGIIIRTAHEEGMF